MSLQTAPRRSSSRRLTGLPMPCGATCSREVKNDIDPQFRLLSVELSHSGARQQPARRLAQRRGRRVHANRLIGPRVCRALGLDWQLVSEWRDPLIRLKENASIELPNRCRGDWHAPIDGPVGARYEVDETLIRAWVNGIAALHTCWETAPRNFR